jgi:hypothetical protein
MPAPPYGEIKDLLNAGNVVPFLGAGCSKAGRPPNVTWSDPACPYPPTGAELARFLATKSNFPHAHEHEVADLAKVASYFVETASRRRLKERLSEVFDRDFQPSEVHNLLAEIPAPLLIFTTNYDDLTERVFRHAGKPFDLVVHPTDRKDIAASILWWKHGEAEPIAETPNRLFIDLSKTTVIYKMHGTVDRTAKRWDSYVITEDDYVDFLSRMIAQSAIPAIFLRHLQTRHFLFLGYGLNDWNLRVILKGLDASEAEAQAEEDEDRKSWAIQYQPSDFEVELWRARQVRIYDLSLEEFVGRLRGA